MAETNYQYSSLVNVPGMTTFKILLYKQMYGRAILQKLMAAHHLYDFRQEKA